MLPLPAALAMLAALAPADPGGRCLPIAPAERKDDAPPACVADWCPARVEIPGQGPSAGKPHKSELLVALLDGAGIEPVASVAWFFVVTGLRVDWTPANVDPTNATARGWGNVFVRLRLRIDAWNRLAVPVRPRERMRQEQELAAQRSREELLRRGAGQVRSCLGGTPLAQAPAP
jgi:hypothetical protein